MISQSIDLVVKKEEERLAVLEEGVFTFQQLADDFYKTKTWTPDTKARNVGTINNHVIRMMGKRDYRKIIKQEWLNSH